MNKNAWERVKATGTLAWRYSYGESENKIICEEIYIIFREGENYVRAWSKEKQIPYFVYAEEKVPHGGAVWLKEKDDSLAADLLIDYFMDKIKALQAEMRYLFIKIDNLTDWKDQTNERL